MDENSRATSDQNPAMFQQGDASKFATSCQLLADHLAMLDEEARDYCGRIARLERERDAEDLEGELSAQVQADTENELQRVLEEHRAVGADVDQLEGKLSSVSKHFQRAMELSEQEARETIKQLQGRGRMLVTKVERQKRAAEDARSKFAAVAAKLSHREQEFERRKNQARGLSRICKEVREENAADVQKKRNTMPIAAHEQIVHDQERCHADSMRDLESALKKQILAHTEGVDQQRRANEEVLKQRLRLAEKENAQLLELDSAAETCAKLEGEVRDAAASNAELQETSRTAETRAGGLVARLVHARSELESLTDCTRAARHTKTDLEAQLVTERDKLIAIARDVWDAKALADEKNQAWLREPMEESSETRIRAESLNQRRNQLRRRVEELVKQERDLTNQLEAVESAVALESSRACKTQHLGISINSLLRLHAESEKQAGKTVRMELQAGQRSILESIRSVVRDWQYAQTNMRLAKTQGLGTHGPADIAPSLDESRQRVAMISEVTNLARRRCAEFALLAEETSHNISKFVLGVSAVLPGCLTDEMLRQLRGVQSEIKPETLTMFQDEVSRYLENLHSKGGAAFANCAAFERAALTNVVEKKERSRGRDVRLNALAVEQAASHKGSGSSSQLPASTEVKAPRGPALPTCKASQDPREYFEKLKVAFASELQRRSDEWDSLEMVTRQERKDTLSAFCEAMLVEVRRIYSYGTAIDEIKQITSPVFVPRYDDKFRQNAEEGSLAKLDALLQRSVQSLSAELSDESAAALEFHSILQARGQELAARASSQLNLSTDPI